MYRVPQITKSHSSRSKNLSSNPSTILPLLQLQRTLGNRQFQQFLQQVAPAKSSLPIMRMTTDKSEVTDTTSATNTTTSNAQNLKEQPNIIYGENGLNEAQARQIIQAIEGDNWEFLKKSELPLRCQGKPYTFDPKKARGQEWGIGISKKDQNAYIYSGGRTGINFAPYTEIKPLIAHSHPYFVNKDMKFKNAGESLDTKEIGQHDDLPVGFVSWNELILNPISSETLKIFPSGADVRECVKYDVTHHTVYTTYIVGRRKQGESITSNDWIVGNPMSEFPEDSLEGFSMEFAPNHQQLKKSGIEFEQFDLLSFEIIGAKQITSQTTQEPTKAEKAQPNFFEKVVNWFKEKISKNPEQQKQTPSVDTTPYIYEFTLKAKKGNQVFWQAQVLADKPDSYMGSSTMKWVSQSFTNS